MTIKEKLAEIKYALANHGENALIDYVNDAESVIEEQERKIQLFGEEALDESLESCVGASVIIQNITRYQTRNNNSDEK